MSKYKVLLFYKYVRIADPDELRDEQMAICKRLDLKGRVIIAHEGINATLEGLETALSEYWDNLMADKRFVGTHLKISEGTGEAFPKLSIKVRPEIVASGLMELDPNKTTGKYLTAEQLHEWIKSGKEFYIVDMRNDYEHLSGYFRNAILPPMSSFRDLSKILPSLEHLKNKTVVTVCTGGVRCEKASGFLVQNNFADVYQLYGGIVTYMEKYPNEDFLGVLYTFDNRLVMGFNLDDPKREVVGRCVKCGKSSERYVNCKDGFCHRHFIACLECSDEKGEILCPMGCRDYSKEHPEVFQLG